MKENVCSFVITPLNITQTDQMAHCGIGKDNNGTMYVVGYLGSLKGFNCSVHS
jgi:hypothetical protein